jgi:hypothetical protein
VRIFSEDDWRNMFKSIDEVREILAMLLRGSSNDTVAKVGPPRTPDPMAATVG